MVTPPEQPRIGQYLRSGVGIEWLQTDAKEAIAGLPFNHLIRIDLRRKRFAEEMQEKWKSGAIEPTEVGESFWFAVREPGTSLLNFTVLFRQLRFKPLSFGLAI